jgi:predicted alpha/beta hydrolase family esterase
MKYDILFIQGAGIEAIAEEKPLVERLQQVLGPDFNLHHPPMPNGDNPHYESWKNFIVEEIKKLSNLILIGHSFGGSVLLKHFAENGVPDNYRGLILMGVPFWGEPGWEYEDFELKEDAGERLSTVSNIYIYHSEDDQEVPFAHLAAYKNLIPGATVREMKDIDHSYEGALDYFEKDIRDMIKGDHG